jgi:hypothetical protein
MSGFEVRVSSSLAAGGCVEDDVTLLQRDIH